MYNLKNYTIVTGGAGFLGSHLCDRLVTRDENVLCVDDYSTGSKSNIAHLKFLKNFKRLDHDVTTPVYFKAETIFNLASPASPIYYQLNPVKTLRTNLLGSMNMLELAKKSKARILQASTSEIYGDPEVHPQPETYNGNINTTSVRSCYDESKRCVETLFTDYHRQYNLDIKIMRIFNTYGPRMQPDDGRVVSNFIMQALHGEDITIYGNGQQTRSFCYVDDLIDGMLLLADSPIGLVEPMNFGNPSEVTMLELAEKILRLTNSKSKLIFCKLPQDDPRQRQPDISLAQSKLNWSPNVTLDDGLKETIHYFQSLS
jgi:UDP-glucuronate decarboxylase